MEIEPLHQTKLIYGSSGSSVFSRLSKWAQALTITLRHQYQVPWLDRCENGLKGSSEGRQGNLVEYRARVPFQPWSLEQLCGANDLLGLA